MRRAAALIFITICALSALSWVEGARRNKPSASMGPAYLFVTSASTTKATSNATTPKLTTTTTKPNTTTTKPTTTTTKPTTTTTKPTTTTTKPTTTTTKPTTTTTKPTTTTTKPTTTTTKPTTTTPKPTTTTTKPTTTTPPSTTPSTNLTVGNYTVTSQGKTCVMVQTALQIRLTTKQANGTFLVQPTKTISSGECFETAATLILSFSEGSISFHFNKSDNKVYVAAVSFNLNYPLVKGDKTMYAASNESLQLFSARAGHSYSCRSQSVYMGNGLYLDVTQTRMQALDLQNGNFGKPDACPADQPDYRVAIAVGVTLLVLILVVVIVYLLGRKKRTDGYQSL